jgi:hypothetical protein
MRGEPLFIDGNDDEPEVTLTRRNTSTGADEAATGLTGLAFRLSASRNGAAIHSSLSKTAAERGTPGIYYATFEGSDLTTQLAAYAGRNVYQIFGDGSNINHSIARKVYAVRP